MLFVYLTVGLAKLNLLHEFALNMFCVPNIMYNIRRSTLHDFVTVNKTFEPKVTFSVLKTLQFSTLHHSLFPNTPH